jgi:hypothetical protein
MFAPTKRDAIRLTGLLYQDSYIGTQDIIFRKYVPLKTFETGMYGLPFGNEWRFFCYKEDIVSYGYYWSCASDEAKQKAKLDSQAMDLVSRLMPIVSKHANFYVLDIAETETGDWILIEINDGQMSGLSENDPEILYYHLNRLVS